MKHPKPVLSLFFVCLVGVSTVQAQTSFSLSPVQMNLKIAAGQSGKGTLTVGNDSYNAVRVQAEIENWTIGTIGFNVFPAEGADGFSCREWIHVEDPGFLLKPGDRRDIAAMISVPPATEPGQYLAAICFKALAGDTTRDRSGVSIQGQLIGVVFVTVGDPQGEGSVLDLAVEKKDGRNVFFIRVKNSSRIYLPLNGEIVLRNAKGKKALSLDMPEEIVPPLSEGLFPLNVGKELPPGKYQAECVLRLPSRKTLEFKKTLDIH